MDLNETSEHAQYRQKVREFIAGQVPPGWEGIGALSGTERDAFNESWRSTIAKNGLLAPGWPVEHGGAGVDVVKQSIVAEEFAAAGVPRLPHPNDVFAFDLIGPTLLHWATDEQKEYFLPRTLSGEIRWAQGYSEPEAGSDLFNLRTRARLEGDRWVVNGHKIWQTGGLTANWIFAMVRTDPDASRSKGLSFLLIPMDQPGVEVVGIENIAGEMDFSEVRFTNAETASTNILGAPGEGARVALTLLGYERGIGGVAAAASHRLELERLIRLARKNRVQDDPLFLTCLGECWTTVMVLECLAMRSLTLAQTGEPPGPESSIIKLVTSEYESRLTEFALDVLGTDRLALTGADAISIVGPEPKGFPFDSSRGWVTDYLHARAGTIYGGSSEIQRNTIAEQILGMPKEPRPPVAPPMPEKGV